MNSTVKMIPLRFIYPVWKSDGTEFIPEQDWKIELVELWKQYKAECYADSNEVFFKFVHKQPTVEGFFDWIERRTK